MTAPILLWLRRDFRLHDHPAMTAAVKTGRPVIPVFILDEVADAHGACPRWRLGLAAERFDKALRAIGSRLIFRRGKAVEVLLALIAETGADTVLWSRLYDPMAVTRDTGVKSALKEQGMSADSVSGHLLVEPWQVETKTGDYYKVYTPFWNQVKTRGFDAPLSDVATLTPPETWPASDDPADWKLDAAMVRGANVVRPFARVGEAAALQRLADFTDGPIADYASARDFPGVDGTSRLSENLTYGEISPRTAWHAGKRALDNGAAGAEIFLKELVWREFAYHLVYHTPRITTGNWREGWDAFPWNTEETPEVLAWKQGRTGIPFVDAAMRELYVTGYMHNRARMIVASYLTKHLLSHWKIGLDWFEDCLLDWDPASNAMGWQWSAGSGPDATPYFRVFNPVTQLDKFDKARDYAGRWIAEGYSNPSEDALAFFDAVPRSWGLCPDAAYPEPVVTPEDGRARALDAYQARNF